MHFWAGDTHGGQVGIGLSVKKYLWYLGGHIQTGCAIGTHIATETDL